MVLEGKEVIKTIQNEIKSVVHSKDQNGGVQDGRQNSEILAILNLFESSSQIKVAEIANNMLVGYCASIKALVCDG